MKSHHAGYVSPTLLAAITAGVVVVGSLGYAKIQTGRLDALRQEYEGFKAQVKANGEFAEREKQRKEAENAKSLKDALTSRDAALAKLRRNNSPSRQLPDNTTTASSSGRVCIATTEYDRAMAEFRKSLERSMADARGIAQEGDATEIDAKSLLESWPK